MKILLLIIFCNIGVFGQTSILRGWRGIYPLSTTRAEVEKQFGESKSSLDGHYIYDNEAAMLTVTYALDPCEGEKPNFAASMDSRVWRYTVTLKRDTPLSTFSSDLRGFRKRHNGDVVNVYDYWNPDFGLTVNTVVNVEGEFVGRLLYSATKADLERFGCRSGSAGISRKDCDKPD